MKIINKRYENKNGITLIALVITIIVLLIIAGITIANLGKNGLLEKTKLGKEKIQKEEATEQINIKITNVEILKYAEKQRMPTLKELADNFCEDKDFDKVIEKAAEVGTIGNLPKILNDNPTAIIVKLKAYPYEFEINKDLQLASIDGTKVSSNTGSSIPTNTDYIMLTSKISKITGGSFQINVNDVEANNSGKLYYFVNDYLVYEGTDKSVMVTKVNGENVTDDTEYNVKVVAESYSLKLKTTSGDNVDSWLACIGNPNSQGYSLDNLDELFANDTLINDLFNSEEAIKYLCNSKNFIFPAVLNTEKIVKKLSQISNDKVRIILSDNKILEAICKSSYASYFDAYSEKVPTLSNDTNTFASSSYASSRSPFRAFDNNFNTFWVTEWGDTGGYIGYNFNKDIMVYKVEMGGYGDNDGELFKDFYVQYLNGNNWKNGSGLLQKERNNSVQTFMINSTKHSTKWRLKATSAWGDKYVACKTLQFYGFPYNDE